MTATYLQRKHQTNPSQETTKANAQAVAKAVNQSQNQSIEKTGKQNAKR